MTSALAEQARAAALQFVGGAEQLPPPPALPLIVQPDFAAGARIGDVLILLGLVGLLLGVGFLLRSVLTRVRPEVFTAGVMAVLLFTVINPLFWQLATVTADSTGVQVARYSASDLQVRWEDLREVRVEGGDLFPIVQDDTALRLVGAGGEHVDIPRYLAGAPALAAAVVAAIEGRSPR